MQTSFKKGVIVIKVKKIFALILVSVFITLAFNAAYVSAGAAVEPIIWTVGEVVGTLLAMVGIKAADSMDDYNTAYTDMFGSDDNVGYFLDEKYIAKAGKTREEIANLVTQMKEKIADAQITGYIEDFTVDMYDMFKTWAEDVFTSKAVAELPTGYEGFFSLSGWEVGSTSSNELSIIATFMGQNNIVVSKLTDTSVYIYILGIDSMSDAVFCYSGNGTKVYTYNKVSGSRITDNAYMQQRSYTNYGTYVSSIAVESTSVMGGTFLYIAPDVNIYDSWADYVAGNPPISVEGEDDYPGVTTVDGVNKLWEKYGNLDNLDVRIGDRSLVGEGVMDIPVVGEKELEGVIGGTIALEDAIPYTLVDTIDNVIIDDTYVDDIVPDIPYTEIDYGDKEPYMITTDLTTIFPFCIPFDLIRVFEVLEEDAQAPYWEIPLKSDTFGIDYTFEIDFSQFEELARIFRIMETIIFILGLILATRGLVKG